MAAQFENIVLWPMLNREGLGVLVHPLTDNSYEDHSRSAVGRGAAVALKLNGAPQLPRRTVSDTALTHA
jgi:aromatic ring-cleaving dioxygenase